MNMLNKETTHSTAKLTFKSAFMTLIATFCLAYGHAQASEATSYWPPAEESYTENSLVVNHVGSAMRYHNNKPTYIASLYSQDEFPNTAVLYSNDGAKELQLIVMDESMSHRRFKRILRNDLIVTLDDKEFTDLQPKIKKMLSSLKDDFRIGSLVTIAYDPLRDATVVRIDSKRKATIDGKELFNATLKTLVGQRPPSRHFKDSLLGQTPAVIDMTTEEELLLTQYIDNKVNKHQMTGQDKQEWVVNSDVQPQF